MVTITNSDTRKSRDAAILTAPSKELQWCIATWPTPELGRTTVTGEGRGWQIVRRQNSGKYTYNGTMMGGYEDSLQDVIAMAKRAGYQVVEGGV